MKFAATLSAAVAPLAMAKAVHNSYPLHRKTFGDSSGLSGLSGLGSLSSSGYGSSGYGYGSSSSSGDLAAAAALGLEAGLSASPEVIVIWENPGGGAATTTVTQPVTVTQTVVSGSTGSASVVAGAAAALTTHQVMVGGDAGLVYTPDTIEANVGDMVVFNFMSTNHTATQSTFTTPCIKSDGGFDSDFKPNADNTTPPPQVAMQVMVDTPLWFYCRQTGHCGMGMTFSINPAANATQAEFQQLAIAQNGTGAATVITGGTASTGGSASVSAAAVGATVAASSSAVAVASATAASSGSLTSGLGTVSAGQCVCAVACGAGSFPAVAAQGVGAFGGFAGSIPAAAVVAL
ncbi:Cupredoxin [Xylariaceae sp. FL0804]|nr:Cupredoxin [Xylariaceae sp. FL0804]